MKINYEIGPNGDCLTPCPNGRVWGNFAIPVSSAGCHKCFYHVTDDDKNRIKVCSYTSQEIDMDIGAHVAWTAVRKTGKTITFTQRHGSVITVSDGIATVKAKKW